MVCCDSVSMRRCLGDGCWSRDPAAAVARAALHVYSPASDSSILVMYRRRLSRLDRSTYTLPSHEITNVYSQPVAR